MKTRREFFALLTALPFVGKLLSARDQEYPYIQCDHGDWLHTMDVNHLKHFRVCGKCGMAEEIPYGQTVKVFGHETLIEWTPVDGAEAYRIYFT